MIITDGVHVVSDISLSELHSEMEKIGISRKYFHGMRKGHPHYDLINKNLKFAKRFKQVSSKKVLESSKFILWTYKVQMRHRFD